MLCNFKITLEPNTLCVSCDDDDDVIVDMFMQNVEEVKKF